MRASYRDAPVPPVPPRPLVRASAYSGGVASPLFHIVLHEPEIPNNTGNIGRTCIATGCALHLIHPLGFETSVKALRRAGLDYWPRLAPAEHANWNAYTRAHPSPRRWGFSTKATRPIWDADLRPGDHLIFGKETAGLPDDILSDHADTLVTLPMIRGERSLNLATAVCAAIYEGLRQCAQRTHNDPDRISLDASGRLTRP